MARLIIFAALFLWAALAAAEPPFIKMLKHQGCYRRTSRTQSWTLRAPNDEARIECARKCVRLSKAVVMFRGNSCYCADTYPMKSLRVDDENCYMPCLKFDQTECDKSSRNVGQRGYFNVYDTGMGENVKEDVEYDLHESKPNPPSIQPAKSAEPEHPRHACYSELPADVKSKHLNLMSPPSCRRLCTRLKNKFALIKDTTCYCTDTYPSKDSLLPDTHCNGGCPKNIYHGCGGNRAYSVYDLEPYTDRVPRPDPQTLPERCFPELPRAATPMPMTLDRSTLDNFHGACIDQCKTAGREVAMMRGTKCYCANHHNLMRSLDTRFCQIPCAGSSLLTCGGQDGRTPTWSGYYTGLKLPVNKNGKQLDTLRPHQKPYSKPMLGEMTSHGCYDATSLTVSHRNSREKNTIENCANYCKREDRAVAATQGKQCLCSNTYPRKSSMVRDHMCRTPCPGYAGDACGGPGRWSVLNTGAGVNVADDKPKTPKKPQAGVAKPAQSELIPYGCFKLAQSDTWHRMDVTGSRIRAQGDSCTFHCATEGYPVALRKGFDCFCTYEKPPESARKDDLYCWYNCHWDKREECGGPKAYTVYNTRARAGVAYDKSGKDDKESAPGASPVTRPQCSHNGLERVKEASSWVTSEAVELGHKAQKAFSGFVDKAQDVFDACLWKVMVTFSDVMVRLGLASNEGGQAGDVDL